MKHYGIPIVACFSFLALGMPLHGAERNSTVNPSSSLSKPSTLNELYPGLTRACLTYAVALELPEGVLLRAGELIVRDKDLNEEAAKAQENLRPKLQKSTLFVLEQIATFKLLLAEAKVYAAKNGLDISEKGEQAIIQDYLRTLAKTVKVGDTEILDFYNNNKETLSSAALAQVKPQIEQFLLQQKQQELINEHVRTIGQRMQIEVSASWLKVQAALAKDNPVDRARDSGKPSLVDFGSTGCVPCDMLAPILETLREKYKGKANVVFVHVGQEPILASRYGIQAIPVQIFFDKAGKEVFRHVS
jgi:thiol-disulfide isomerase/thioredoxin